MCPGVNNSGCSDPFNSYWQTQGPVEVLVCRSEEIPADDSPPKGEACTSAKDENGDVVEQFCFHRYHCRRRSDGTCTQGYDYIHEVPECARDSMYCPSLTSP